MFEKKLHHLEHMISPRSIAVVGATRDKKKIGAIVLKNIIDGGFSGKIYPVNPAAGIIQKLQAYSNYSELPQTPDLAVIAVPANVVPLVLEEIGKKGTKNVIILSAGFKEVGEKGKIAEEELIAIAKKYTISIIGPNCLGILNATKKLNATFGEASLFSGNLRFISQSGAIATSFFDWAGKAGLGFSEFITLGNKANINENDILDYWQSKSLESSKERQLQVQSGLSSYEPIGLYLESIVNGEKFFEHIKKISPSNPIFLLKPGKSNGAQKAMLSHTGSIAGNDAVLDAALHEAGVIRCHGMEDLFDLAKAFAWESSPLNNKVVVISNAGGPAVLSADLIEEAGLEMAVLNTKTHKILLENLPRTANINDPIDVLGDALADRYATALNAVLADNAVDAVVVLLTPQMTTQISETAKIISDASTKFGKPIVTAFIGGSQVAKGESILNARKIPCFRYPDRAIWVLGRMWAWEKWRQEHKKPEKLKQSNLKIKKPAQKLLHLYTKSNVQALSPLQADKVMSASGICTSPLRAALTFESAETFLQRHKKIVLKISSSALLHKTELHGVIAHIDTPQKLRLAWKELSRTLKKVKRSDQNAEIIVQKQIVDGIELIVGVKTDSNFGKVLLFGAGGIMVELISDRNLHTLPLSQKEIEKLIKNSKINKLLVGYRGNKPYATKKLVKTILRLIPLALASEIDQIEINPLIITPKEVFAVDGKIILK